MNPALAKPLLVAGAIDCLVGGAFALVGLAADVPSTFWIVGVAMLVPGLGLVLYALRVRAAVELEGKR